MKIFQKQTTRRTVVSLFLVLLLALAICISTVGVTTYINANRQLQTIDESYTTTAILLDINAQKLNMAGTYTYTGEDSMTLPDGSAYIGPVDAIATARKSKHYVKTERQILLSAHVEGMFPLSSGRLDYMDYKNTIDSHCYSVCVAALECIRYDMNAVAGRENIFRVIDWISRSSAYDLEPIEENIVLTSFLANEDGSAIFEAGKTYLMRGFFFDFPVWNEGSYGMVRDLEYGRYFVVMGLGDTLRIPNYQLRICTSTDGVGHYEYDPGFGWPMVTEYTGDWRDFLETDAGRVWKEEIIPHVEICQNSAPVILTDMLESMYNFNTGTASILEGRSFTKEEYEQGEKVCIISAAYAGLNGLHLGDKLSLDFYDSGYTTEIYGTDVFGGRGITIQRLPMLPQHHMDAKADYTIVGIYTAPEWGPGVHDFNADTIFVPKQSVAGWQTCAKGPQLPMLTSVIIENGSIEEFQAHMEAEGMGLAFGYFDQGYSELKSSLLTLLENARRMLAIGLPVFLLATLVFLLLDGRRRGNVIRSLRLLGVKRGQIWFEAWGAELTMALAAILLGNLLGALFFQKVTENLLSTSLALNPTHILVCAGIQILVVAALSAVWMAVASGRNLMNRK